MKVSEFSLFAVLLAFSPAGHASDEAGRWAGEWVLEEPPVSESESVGDAADEPLVEGGVPDIDLGPAFAAAPDGFLVDYQKLLSPETAGGRREFLRHHAEDSRIDLYVYLFGGGTGLPAGTGVERHFAGRDAAVVFYFMGEPQRAGFYLPPALVEVVSDAEQRRSLQSSVMQASDKLDPEAQLEAFLVQMSIRLYWMERMLDDELPGVVRPVEPVDKLTAEPTTVPPGIPWSHDWLPWTVAAAFVLLGLPVLWWTYRLRARYLFPEFEVEPRLGGRHGAGVGAVISYLSPNVPPASQRDQVPDSLRRM